MICPNCGQKIVKGDMTCSNCGSDQLVTTGMFGWGILGFIGGLFIPSLIDFIAVIFLSDKKVLEDFFNPTIIGRSRWHAARIGIIIGAISQTFLLLTILLLILCGFALVGVGLRC